MKQRVLVVDDDHLVADTLNLVFKANGYESEAVYSAADGLARARTFNHLLMLCDISMPEVNGLQLAEALQLEMPSCKVLMLTAYASNAAKVEQHITRTQRPLRLLSKPCRPELLLSEAHSLLQSA
ncbi:MAG: response regulator [Acidobacteriaceae bacterium]